MGETFEAAAVWFPADRLVFWDRNPNQHPDRQLAKLRASFVANGWGDSATAQAGTSRLISGHGRVMAVRQLLEEDPTWALPGSPGPGLVPVRFVDLPWEQCVRLGIASNEIARGAKIDEDILAGLLRSDALERSALSAATGIEERAMIRLLAAQESPPLPPVPVPPAPESKAGEVYQLGPHRLVCGDSTKDEAWRLLMGEERAQMVWSDPPYGVAVNAVSLKDAVRLNKRTDGLLVPNDDLSPEELRAFLWAALSACNAHCKPGAAWYIAAPPGPPVYEFGSVLRALEVWRHTLSWVKQKFVMGRCDYHYRHETVFYGWKPGAAHYFVDDRTLDSVHEFDRPDRSMDHPTTKPVELVRFHIRNSSKPGWLVCDPFSGSGTTLIACAAEGRVARCIELDPGYCDVIRRRWWLWCQESGQDAGPDALAAVT